MTYGFLGYPVSQAVVINMFLSPIREKRIQLEKKPDYIKNILMTGTERVKAVAKETLEEVRESMRIKYF